MVDILQEIFKTFNDSLEDRLNNVGINCNIESCDTDLCNIRDYKIYLSSTRPTIVTVKFNSNDLTDIKLDITIKNGTINERKSYLIGSISNLVDIKKYGAKWNSMTGPGYAEIDIVEKNYPGKLYAIFRTKQRYNAFCDENEGLQIISKISSVIDQFVEDYKDLTNKGV